MDNALMLGLQTQRVLQRRMDIAANNLANVATTGFKADGIWLQEADNTEAHAEAAPTNIRFVRDMGLVRNMQQGAIAMTGNPLDVAIEGEGFFMVQGPNGQTLYTRDGAFSLAGDGRLVTSDGYSVLSGGERRLCSIRKASSLRSGATALFVWPVLKPVASVWRVSPHQPRFKRSGTTFGTRTDKERVSLKAWCCKELSKAPTYAPSSSSPGSSKSRELTNRRRKLFRTPMICASARSNNSADKKKVP
ncbi:MAG: flagellar hook-basal body complex protein [Hyphomonadaceae bacterium JAD_PAG50586_4]|nr:MAG: flagellar hook-basal body complex protein [Hyphomonadaceae bacterium JAD_PAG50586_4]